MENDKKFYVLGSFAYTEHHIIFFPSLIDQKIITHNGQSFMELGTVSHLDHFTLDNSLKDWHVKTVEKIKKIPTMHTQEIEDETRLWFVWRICHVNVLESAPKTSKMNFNISGSDSERRLKLIQQCIAKSVHQITKLDENIKDDFFWNVEFFVTTKKRKPIPNIPVTLQHCKKSLVKARKQDKMRIHHIQLEGFNGWIIIRISKVEGKILTDSQFLSGDSFNFTS